ncbi:hypothetical protein WEB32_34110 [Streptomyces netropsis]|uniref:hypothetical protein n=1 Tax=Streptomyces netropsis TaxID=55404 RepID=UPI0030CBE495
MKENSMRSLGSHRLVTGLANIAAGLSLCLMLTGAAAAADVATVMHCSGSFTMIIGGFVGNAQGNGDLDCTLPSESRSFPAAIRMLGSFSETGHLTTTTNDTVTSDTGEVTRLRTTRAFDQSAGQVRESGSGISTGGFLHPSKTFEWGHGHVEGAGEVTIYTVDDFFLELEPENH